MTNTYVRIVHLRYATILVYVCTQFRIHFIYQLTTFDYLTTNCSYFKSRQFYLKNVMYVSNTLFIKVHHLFD